MSTSSSYLRRAMRRVGAALAVTALIAALAACGQLEPAAPALEAPGDAAPMAADGQRYLVVAGKGARAAQVEGTIAAAGGQVVRALPQVGIYAATSSDPSFLSGVRGRQGVQLAEAMSYTALPQVFHQTASAEMLADLTPAQIPDPPSAFFDLLWGVARVQAPAAWERGVVGSHDTVVAVIDTGIASNHPDVGPNIVHDACFVTTGDHTTGACLPYPSLSFHGTHVAGTIAANPGGGVIGVGPGLGLANYNVFELFEIEPGVFGVLAAFDSVFAAILDAADQDFDVINMSLGAVVQFGGRGSNEVAALRAAVKRVLDQARRAGTVVVASAGNASLDLTGPLLNLPGGAGAINVGATGIRPDPVFPQEGFFDVLAFYSNHGAPVDIAAPGGDCGLPDDCNPDERPANWVEHLVLSAFVDPEPACAVTESCPVGWAFAAGTSMAAPHVSGAAGLVRDAKPHLGANQVRSLLLRTADGIGHRLRFGHGLVDADAATR